MLFEEKIRDSKGYMRVDESTYDFYDRSDMEIASKIRNRFNQWLELVPFDEDRNSLISSFKDNWDSSYFELFLIKLFSCLNYEIEIHPSIPGSSNRPDFILQKNDMSIICEARDVTDKTDKERSIEKIKHVILDGINRNMSSRDFFLSIHEIHLKEIKSPSLKLLYTQLKKYLDEINKEKLIEDIENGSFGYQKDFIFSNDDFFIRANVLPKSNSSIQTDLIGMHSLSGATFVSTNVSIVSAIQKKYKKYGIPDSPFVLALNISSDYGIHFSEIDDLLYGTGVYDMDTKKTFRKKDGLFGHSRNHKMTRVSGILFFRSHYSNPENSIVRFYENPHATHPYRFDDDFPITSFDYKTIYRVENDFDIRNCIEIE